MVRAALAVTASLILVGILGLLIKESRSVDEKYYAAHAERVRAIESTRDDLSAIVLGAQSAHKEGRSIPTALNVALSRIATSNQVLQSRRG